LISFASPGASAALRDSSAGNGAPVAVVRALNAMSSGRCDALRIVNVARKRSPSRTSGGSPDSSIRSCVDRMDASPVPNRPAPEDATATIRKLVSESFSGISTTALPASSSGTRAFHKSSVSNSSRDDARPPPQPGAIALRPKWRLPITCICAVKVFHFLAAARHHRVEQFHELFGRQLEQAFIHGRQATSLPFGGALPSGRRTAMVALAVLAYLVGRPRRSHLDGELVRVQPMRSSRGPS
jgi:hypothetical protein